MEVKYETNTDSKGKLLSPGELLDSVMSRGAVVGEALQLVRAYYSASEQLFKSQLNVVDELPSGSVSLRESASSRSSRRSVRRELYLQKCAELPSLPGFCYLLLVRLPSRKSVADRLGSFPDILQLLGIRAEELDIGSLSGIDFVSDDGYNYHVQQAQEGNALGMLRRTLGVYKSHGQSMRDCLGVDQGDGDFFSMDSVFGAELPSLRPRTEHILEYDSHEQMDASRDLLQDLIQRRIPMSVAYHWPVKTRPALVDGFENDCFVRCSDTGDVVHELRRFAFSGVSCESILVLPPKIYAHEGDVIVGSSEHVTSVVVDEESAFDILVDGDAWERDRHKFQTYVPNSKDPGDSCLWLDLIRLQNQSGAMWKMSSCYTDKRSIDVRYAAEVSWFYLHSVPYPDSFVTSFRGVVQDVTPLSLRRFRFIDQYSCPVSGPDLISVNDHHTGKMRLFARFKYASGHFIPVRVSHVLVLASYRACATVNIHRVQPLLHFNDCGRDVVGFDMCGLRYRNANT